MAGEALSVKTRVLFTLPTAVGVKLRLTVQLAPGVRENFALQSAGVPGPNTCLRFVATVMPGDTAFKGRSPTFETVSC